MNTQYVLISRSKINIPEPLLDGHDYAMAITGEIRGFTSEPDDAGGRDITWRYMPLKIEILKPTGETLKVSKYKQSQKIRLALRDKWLRTYTKFADFDEYYKSETDKIISEINGIES